MPKGYRNKKHINYLNSNSYIMKKKFICTVCGYVHEGEEAPEFCPQCKQPKSKFKELVETEGALQFVDEHVLGIAKGVDPEILEGLKAKFTQYGINAIKDSLESLTNKHLINRIDESLPIQSKLVLLELSDLGKEIYYIETGKKAKLSEIEYMKHNHASLKHGYAIKRISEILRVQGYKNVCYDSRENTIALNDNRRYVPDIIANLDDKTKTYWEVEYAHHTDVAFTEKIDKAAKVTNTLYIIGSDKKAKEKLKRQIDEYQKNLFINDGKMKLDIYLGTMTELQKKTFLNLPDNHIKIRA